MFLFNYYRQKEDENGNIIFEKIKEEDFTICGKTIEEIITILQGLDFERETQIKMVMGNLQKYVNFIREDENRAIQEAMTKAIEGMNLKGTDNIE